MCDKLYDDRDIMGMDDAGGYYIRHIMAMTKESLHSKSDIAAELGFRDMQIDAFKKRISELEESHAQVVEARNLYKNMILNNSEESVNGHRKKRITLRK